MTALTPAEEEGERPDVVSRLHAEIVYARTRGHNGRAMLLEAAKAEIERLRALLSSPRVEEVRREAFEEAAKVADEMAGNLKHLGATIYPYVQIGSHLETCKTIAKSIRSLSPQGG